MGFFRKEKVWDEERNQANKEKMRLLFNQVVEDSEGYHIVYGISQKVKTSNYILARKTTYLFTSLIIGFRESDMSIILIQTTPELDGCSDPEKFTMNHLKKAKIVQGQFVLYYEGGIMAGYTDFCIMDSFDEDYTVYIHQPEEAAQFDVFWPAFLASK
ncbi:MAG: hypothetical protein RR630_01040 [Coprobacillus sp.]